MNIKENPHVSVDCVIFGFDLNELQVLLVDRPVNKKVQNRNEFIHKTLPGDHILDDENLDEAAQRILKELTGVTNIFMEQFHAFGSLNRLNKQADREWLRSFGRDPETRVVTVGYFSLINTKVVEIKFFGRNAKWYPVKAVSELAFDHKNLLDKALETLRYKIKTQPIGFDLLPPKFTLTQLQKLYEAILGRTLDKRNFRKKIGNIRYIIPLNEKQKGVAHKPAQLYKFDKKVFEKSWKENYQYNF